MESEPLRVVFCNGSSRKVTRPCTHTRLQSRGHPTPRGRSHPTAGVPEAPLDGRPHTDLLQTPQGQQEEPSSVPMDASAVLRHTHATHVNCSPATV